MKTVNATSVLRTTAIAVPLGVALVLTGASAMTGCGDDPTASASSSGGPLTPEAGVPPTIEGQVDAGVPAVLPAPDPCDGVNEPRSCCLGRLRYGGLAGTDNTCGPNGNESCCKFDDISGGTFNRHNDPAFPATLPNFKLGRYLVTTARLKVWMNEGGGLQTNAPPVSPAAGSGVHPTLGAVTGWQADWNAGGNACGGVGCLAKDETERTTRFYKDPASIGWGCTLDHYPAHPRYPADCVSYYDAVAFCAWDGGYLITDAMWEYATRGGNEQRTYAWGSHAPDSLDYSVHCVQGGGTWNVDLWCTNPSDPAPRDVGFAALGQGKFGTYDLQSNLMQLTLDEETAPSNPPPMPCTNDCVRRPTPATNRAVVRGIAFAYPNNLTPYEPMMNTKAVTFRKNFWSSASGIRCAYPNNWSSP